MSTKIEPLESGILDRFISDVKRRCAAVGVEPPVLCVLADVGYGCWRSWAVDGVAPKADTMDKVLAELEKQEKMRGKR